MSHDELLEAGPAVRTSLESSASTVERGGISAPVPSSQQIGWRLKIGAGAIALVLIAAFGLVNHMRSDSAAALRSASEAAVSAPPTVTVVTVQKAPAAQSLELPGETAAWYQATIYARVDGYVGNWSADIGDHVTKGQVLATIETPDLDAKLAAAKARLKADEATVKAKESEADFAKTTYERWRDSPKGVVSEQEREAKKADFSRGVAQLNASRAEVALDQANVDGLTALTAFKVVTAPFDGIITKREIDIGNLVTAGSTASTTPLYQITQDDPMRVFVDVPQNASRDMRVGTPVRISPSGWQGRIFEGRIARTARAIDPRSRTLRVEVDLPNPDKALVPGLYVKADFKVEAGGAVEVPAAALVFRSGGPQVAVVTPEDKVVFQDVVIARDNGQTLALTSGVSAGQKVILNVGSQIAEGEKVMAAEAGAEGAAAAPPDQGIRVSASKAP
jgi:RND family efflux transporter MFP subunit